MLLKARCPRSEEDVLCIAGHATYFSRKPTEFALACARSSDALPQLASYGKQQLTLIYFYSTNMYHGRLYKTVESILLLTNFKARCCNDRVIHPIKSTVPYEELLIPLSDLNNTSKCRGLLSLGQKGHDEIRYA